MGRRSGARALLAAVLTVLTLAACTESSVAPTAPTGGVIVDGTGIPPEQTRVGEASSATAATSMSTAQPAAPPTALPGSLGSPVPEMTAIDTLRCAASHDLPAANNPFPDRVLWGASADRATGTGGAVETVPGPDAVRCAHVLPSGCDSPPWSWPPNERFLVASGATRRLRGESGIAGRPSSTGPAQVVDRQSVQWGALELPPGDPLRVVSYLQRSAITCASASPATIGGRPALVGTARSDYRQGPAVLVLLTGTDAAAWLTVDGTTVMPAPELARIVIAAATHLLRPA